MSLRLSFREWNHFNLNYGTILSRCKRIQQAILGGIRLTHLNEGVLTSVCDM